MLTFNLKKEWFEKIKSGEKTHEYREVKDYWTSRLMKHLYGDLVDNKSYFISQVHYGKAHRQKNLEIVLAEGYPKKEEKEKILHAIIKKIEIIHGRRTDLKINSPVYDIEFELINEVKNER